MCLNIVLKFISLLLKKFVVYYHLFINHSWHVNTTLFYVKDKHTIKVLSQNNCYGAECLYKMFLTQQWTLRGLKTLIQRTEARNCIEVAHCSTPTQCWRRCKHQRC